MVGLDQIDLTKIIMPTIIQKSEIKSKKLSYFVTALEWNQDTLVMGINFTNPMVISDGKVND